VERIPLSPPPINPLAGNINRPLWSVMIPAYNCSFQLKKTLVSVIKQDPGKKLMQIEVVDDFSTDADVEKLVNDIGEGRISYYRQPANVGSLRNFETCINRACGYYVHLLHGDDRVKDGFYKKMGELFERFPHAGAAFCAYDMIREDDSLIGPSKKEADYPTVLENWLYRIAVESCLQYVCMVVKREVYEKLGSFYLTTYGEDWEMWTRIAKHFPTAYTPETLAEYRVHTNSITNSSFLTGANVKDIGKIIEKITTHLPIEDQPQINTAARKYYAYDAIKKTYGLWYRSKNKKAVNTQIDEILHLYKDMNLLSRSMLVKMFMLIPHKWLPRIRGAFKKNQH
jgi:glycosyltransferase involved in cell wall biosynthesis